MEVIDLNHGKISNQIFMEKLVGGWTNPFEKYARQIGSFPQGVKLKHLCSHHLEK